MQLFRESETPAAQRIVSARKTKRIGYHAPSSEEGYGTCSAKGDYETQCEDSSPTNSSRGGGYSITPLPILPFSLERIH
jgi:hypothetical protein